MAIGEAADLPRALQHPAVLEGRFVIADALAIDGELQDTGRHLDQLAELVAEHKAQTILVAGQLGSRAMRDVADLAVLTNCELLAVMPTEVLAGHHPMIVWTGDNPLVQLAPARQAAWQIAAKRAVDVIGASVGLLITAPILGVLAAGIMLESPGLPIFKHERVGYRGKRFKCLKLRTMRIDAEETLRRNPDMYAEYKRNHYKIPEHLDPRVTLLGWVLRRTSLDELPQLWNVLVGDMSLVGPRPVVEEELAVYNDSAVMLTSVRPGITGAWAVSGRHCVGYPERCQIEIDYVRHWTLRGDASIMVRTVGAVAAFWRS